MLSARPAPAEADGEKNGRVHEKEGGRGACEGAARMGRGGRKGHTGRARQPRGEDEEPVDPPQADACSRRHSSSSCSSVL